METNKFDESDNQFCMAAQIEPNNAIFSFRMVSSSNTREVWRSRGLFKQAVVLNPHHGEGHFYLGTAYIKIGSIQDAIGSLKIAAKINPKHIHTLTNLGVCYTLEGEIGMAIASYKSALQIDSELTSTKVSLANLYDLNNDSKNAFLLYSEVIKIEPNNVKALIGLGKQL